MQDDLLSDKGNSIFELESKFNESYRNQDRCSTKTCDTMYRHTCVRWFSESILQQFKPFIHHLEDMMWYDMSNEEDTNIYSRSSFPYFYM